MRAMTVPGYLALTVALLQVLLPLTVYRLLELTMARLPHLWLARSSSTYSSASPKTFFLTDLIAAKMAISKQYIVDNIMNATDI